jgi:hypothetical protein
LLLIKRYLSYSENIYIEEPELSLFQSVQKDLIQYLITKVNTKNHLKLFINTHSPDILFSFTNSAFAGKILKENPKASKDVYKLIPKNTVIDPSEISAYLLKDGKAESIINNNENGLFYLKEDSLLQNAENLSGIFNQLSEIQSKHQSNGKKNSR